jgi:hypothetical protein
MYEFRPCTLYTEQIMRIYPEELTCRLKILPAFEESLMAISEK